MRALVFVCVAAGVLSGGYWLGAAYLLPGFVNGQIARQPDMEGYAQQVTGFPFRFEMALDTPAWRSPVSGLAWRSARVTAEIPSFLPNHLRLDFPAPQYLTLAGQDLRLDSTRFVADMALGLDLAVSEAGAHIAEGQLVPAFGVQALEAVDLRVTAQEGGRYALALDGREIQLAPALVESFGPAAGVSDRISALRLDAILSFDGPLALVAPVPLMRQIDIEGMRLVWGEMQFGLAGQVRRGELGELDGDLTLIARNWEPILRALVLSGVIAPDIGGFVGMFLAGAADPATGEVTLPVLLRSSVLSLGPFALLELPRL
jgi:hypothetical protein